jgi:hypothetical protein
LPTTDSSRQSEILQFMIPKFILPHRRIHETTRRRWCRLALVGFAWMPFVFLLIFSAVNCTSWYRDWEKREWEGTVGRTLGISVSAMRFRWTAPMQFHADEVEIRHPETHAILGRIGAIDGMMKPQGWSVILDQPILDGEQLDRGIDVLHDWFLCRPQISSKLLALAIPNGMTIHHGVQKTALTRIDLVFRPSERASMIHAKWRLEDQPFGEVCLHVARQHDANASSTKLELSSPSAWIPCSLAKDRFPSFPRIGEGARFRGVLQYQADDRSWDAMVSGEVHDIDLGSMTANLGSPLRGLSALSLQSLHVRDGRILKTSGEWRLRAGSVSGEWIRRLSDCLRLPAQWQWGAQDFAPVEQIGMAFNLDPSGIQLTGTIPDSNGSPSILARMGSSVLFADGKSIPIHQLIQGLQIGQVDVSALSSVLPIPQSKSPERKESAAASWLRLSRTQDRPVPQ